MKKAHFSIMALLVFWINPIFLKAAVSNNSRYAPAKLVLWTDVHDGMNVGPKTYFFDSNPQINDHRHMGVTLKTINGELEQGIWIYRDGWSGIVYQQKNELEVSDLSLNAKGDFVFTEHAFDEYKGVFLGKWNGEKYEVNEIVTLGDHKLIYYQNPMLSENGFIAARGRFDDGSRAIWWWHKTKSKIIDRELFDHFYLFNPAFSENNGPILAYKARLNQRNSSSVFFNQPFSQSQADVVKLYFQDKVKVVAADSQYLGHSIRSPMPEFEIIRNGVDVNSKGQVLFVGQLKNGIQQIWLTGPKIDDAILIASSDQGSLQSIDYFTPTLNNQGMVAFRGQTTQGHKAIFISIPRREANLPDLVQSFTQTSRRQSSGQRELMIVLEEFEIIKGKEEGRDLLLFYGTHNHVFAGRVGLNNRGDLLINASFSDPETGQIDRGKGLIFIEALQ